MKPEFKARYAPNECKDRPYQAQWYTGTRYHADGYERGSWYPSEQEAIDAAQTGKRNQAMIEAIVARIARSSK